MTAAPVNFTALSVKGLITVIPFHTNTLLLSAILCSSFVAKWIKHETPALINPRFQTINLWDIKDIPIPISASQYLKNTNYNQTIKKPVTMLCRDIVSHAKQLQQPEATDDSKFSLLEMLDSLVERLYETQ